MKRIISFALTALLAGCGTSQNDVKTDSTSGQVVVSRRPSISDVQVYRPNIDYTSWEGDLYDAVYWRDARGENAVIISGRPQYFWEEEHPEAEKFFPKGEDKETMSELTELFAMHYVLRPGKDKWEVLQSYHDYLFGCCDVWMLYQPASLEVLDADSNGTGETFFMYHQTEGDGMIDHNYLGTLVLVKDSAFYSISNETGLGAELRAQKGEGLHDRARWQAPSDALYTTVMKTKWDELYRKQVELDRAAMTEQNNVDEHGHADHVH